MSYGGKFYRSVRDAIAYLVIGCTSVDFNFARSYGDVLYSYKLQVTLTSLFYLFNNCTANDPLRTDHKNVVPKFQRLTLLNLPSADPFPYFNLVLAGPARKTIRKK